MVTERTRIETSASGTYEGISFKGDFTGWDAAIRAYAATNGLRVATISQDCLVVGEQRIPLADCKILMY